MSSNSAVAATADLTGPVVRKNQFRGVLFKYGPNPIQVRLTLLPLSEILASDLFYVSMILISNHLLFNNLAPDTLYSTLYVVVWIFQ